jgi:hypothetical protein
MPGAFACACRSPPGPAGRVRDGGRVDFVGPALDDRHASRTERVDRFAQDISNLARNIGNDNPGAPAFRKRETTVASQSAT